MGDSNGLSSIAQSRMFGRSSIQNPMDDDLSGISVIKASQSFISNKENSEHSPMRVSTTSTMGANNSQLQKKYSSVGTTHHTPSKSVNVESQKGANKTTEKRAGHYVSRTASVDTIDIPSNRPTANPPLETSFADADHAASKKSFEKVSTTSSTVDNRPEKLSQAEKKPKRNIDIDSIPINYQEYVKKTDRSRLKTETEHSLMAEVGMDNHLKSDPIIITTQEEQPQFGTSHFMMDNNELVQKFPSGHYTDDDKHDYDDVDRLFERGDLDDDFVSERLSHAFKKKTNRVIGKSFTRDDLDNRPSIMMNPMQSVQEYDMKDTFETQFSTDMISGKGKATTRRSVMGQGEEKKPSESRSRIEERLKGLEHKLREMELKNQGLKVEKDKVQIEFEKLMLELKQANADTSMLEGNKKEEKEMALKNEIKFLINKLLKVKNKLEKQSEELNSTKINASQSLNYSQVNSSVMLPSNSMSYFYKDKSSVDVSRSYMGNSIVMNSTNANKSYAEMENFDISESRSKNTLGQAIENFAKNIRSKSNMRYDHSRVSQNLAQSHNSINTASVTNLNSQRARTPLLERGSDYKNAVNSMIMNRETLRDTINSYGGSTSYARKSYK